MPIHGKQAEVVSGQRRNATAPASDVHQKILSEAQQQFEAPGCQLESWHIRHGMLELSRKRRGNPVLGEVGKILAKRPHRLGVLPAEGEHLLELIENENRRQQLIALTPQLEIRAMEALPK